MKAPDSNLNALTNIVGLYEELRWLLRECGDVETKCLLRPDLLPLEQVIDIRLHLNDELVAQFISNIRRIRAALTKSEIEPASDVPPLPKEDEPWSAVCTPDQVHTFLTQWATSKATLQECADSSRISLLELVFVIHNHKSTIAWLVAQDEITRWAYLNELLRINRIRFDRTHAGESDCAGTPSGDPAPVYGLSNWWEDPTMLEDREQDAYRKFASDLDAAKLDVEYFFAGMVEQCRRYGNFKDKDFDYVREFSDALMADKHFGSRTREHVIKLVFYRRRREAYDLASLAPTPVDREDMAEQAARLQV